MNSVTHRNDERGQKNTNFFAMQNNALLRRTLRNYDVKCITVFMNMSNCSVLCFIGNHSFFHGNLVSSNKKFKGKLFGIIMRCK